jgi:hypothetical protein
MNKKLRIIITSGLLYAMTIHTNTVFAGISNFCSFNNCNVGDIVTTSYSQGSPAVGCPTKSLSLYANYVITMLALGSTEKELERSDATFMSQIRNDAGVSNLKAAMRKCWQLKDGQQVKILEYSKGGSVNVSSIKNDKRYWTQANHLDKLLITPATETNDLASVMSIDDIANNAKGIRKDIILKAQERVAQDKNKRICPIFKDSELEAIIVNSHDSLTLMKRYSNKSSDASTVGTHTNLTVMRDCEKQGKRVLWFWDTHNYEAAHKRYPD